MSGCSGPLLCLPARKARGPAAPGAAGLDGVFLGRAAGTWLKEEVSDEVRTFDAAAEGWDEVLPPFGMFLPPYACIDQHEASILTGAVYGRKIR